MSQKVYIKLLLITNWIWWRLCTDLEREICYVFQLCSWRLEQARAVQDEADMLAAFSISSADSKGVWTKLQIYEGQNDSIIVFIVVQLVYK
jgi:hypothetical protein